RTTPIALFRREHAGSWLTLAPEPVPARLSSYGVAVLEVLQTRGACFLPEIVTASALLPTQVEQALSELAAFGLVTSDSFAGLRALLTPSAKRAPLGGRRRRYRTVPFDFASA